MKKIVLQSPAKLNLHLRILGKRPDGYHELLTFFHQISLTDTLRLQKKPNGFTLTTNIPELETGEGNLITKAYRLLQKKIPSLKGVSVRLTKRIPLGGGLGGGSSNAAFFLLGMKQLYGLKISQKELLSLGKKLGADVPFFLSGARQAVAWGIGEKMQKVPARGKLWFLLLISNQRLNTKKVYENLDQRTGRFFYQKLARLPPVARSRIHLTKEKGIVRILRLFLSEKRIREAADYARNDLESSAFCLRPSIPKAIAKLKNLGASFVHMSGSGPTVFAVFSSRQEVSDFARKLKQNPIPYHKVICHSF